MCKTGCLCIGRGGEKEYIQQLECKAALAEKMVKHLDVLRNARVVYGNEAQRISVQALNELVEEWKEMTEG